MNRRDFFRMRPTPQGRTCELSCRSFYLRSGMLGDCVLTSAGDREVVPVDLPRHGPEPDRGG